MAQFKPIRVTNKTSLDNIQIKEGQLIICEEEESLYFDKNNTERILMEMGTEDGDMPEFVTFSEGTDEQIAAMLDAHYQGKFNIADCWSVGSTRKIHLNEVANPYSGSKWPEQDITIVITAMNHHDLATPINGITKAAITCQTRECVNDLTQTDGTQFHIYPNLRNSSSAFTDDMTWAGNKIVGMRTWGNETFFNTMLPEGTRNMIKEITRQVKITHSGNTLTKARDKIFLPTTKEILTAEDYTSTDGGTQWEYYKTSVNRLKYGNNNGVSNGTASYWWTGSPSTTYAFWSCLYTTGLTKPGTENINARLGYAPAFCM